MGRRLTNGPYHMMEMTTSPLDHLERYENAHPTVQWSPIFARSICSSSFTLYTSRLPSWPVSPHTESPAALAPLGGRKILKNR